MENVKIENFVVPPTEGGKPVVVHVLQGEAPKSYSKEPVPVNITGGVESVVEFLTSRAQNKELAHVEVSMKERKITLFCDPTNPLKNHKVTGVLKIIPELDALNVNPSSTSNMPISDLRGKLLFYRRFVESEERCLELTQKLP